MRPSLVPAASLASLVLGAAIFIPARLTLAQAVDPEAPVLTPRAEVLDRLAQERIRRLRDYEEWNQKRIADHQRLLDFRVGAAGVAATAPTSGTSPLYRLPDPEIPAGFYTLPTVGGRSYRVEVYRGDEATTREWSRSEYEYMIDLASQVARRLREIEFYLRRQDRAEQVQPAMASARDTLATLQTALQQRDPLETVRRDHLAFEDQWRGLSQALQPLAVRDTRLQRLIDLADESNRTIQLAVTVAPGPLYDRLRVAALAQQLVGSTEKLEDGLDTIEQPNWLISRLRGQAEDVRKSATRLANIVEQNAPFQEVVAQFEDFDAAWRRLVDRFNRQPAKVPLNNAEDIWYADRTLRQLLRVQPAFVAKEQRLDAALTELQDDAAALGREIRALRAGKAAADAADAEFEQFVTAVNTLRTAVQEHADAEAIRTHADTVALDWAPFRRDFLRTEPADKTLDLVKRIDEDIKNLPVGPAPAAAAPAPVKTPLSAPSKIPVSPPPPARN